MIEVVWLSLHDDLAAHCCWDQDMLAELLRDQLWPTGLGLVERERLEDVQGEGAVVVLPARYHVDDAERLNDLFRRFGWLLVILTSDEESLFPWKALHHRNMRRWIMTPRPGQHEGADHYLGEFWPRGTREAVRQAGDPERVYDWFFAGQVTHPSRRLLVQVLETADGYGRIVRSPSFTAGLERADYLDHLVRTKVAPAPSGPATPDSFRLYEALEAGCVPVVEDGCPAGVEGYWQMLFGEDPPFPVLGSWGELPPVMDDLLAEWPAPANRSFAWWQQYKRGLSLALADDLRALGAPVPAQELGEDVTVVVTTSPIPSHPSTEVIETTLASIREQLPKATIVIAADGVRPEQERLRQDYQEYVRRLLWLTNHELERVVPFVAPEHLHQAQLTRRALDLVRTPLMLFVEHDTPLCDEIDWAGLSRAVLGGEAHVVRLHHEALVLAPHEHLMLDREPQLVGGAPMLRTAQWSQRPHLTSTDWYREMLDANFGPRAKTMIEDVMHGIVVEDWRAHGVMGWDRYRLWLYAPEGHMKRSLHLDGRAGEPKYEMVFDRPGRDSW